VPKLTEPPLPSAADNGGASDADERDAESGGEDAAAPISSAAECELEW
jgi:hypothetical protein